MEPFATKQDVIDLWRPLTAEELERTDKLIEVISDNLRIEAKRVGKNLDNLAADATYKNVLKSVIVDIVARTLMTSTENEPMIQESQSALGYTWSGTYLVPGGGLFIKKTELARLGLKTQRYGAMEIYGQD